MKDKVYLEGEDFQRYDIRPYYFSFVKVGSKKLLSYDGYIMIADFFSFSRFLLTLLR